MKTRKGIYLDLKESEYKLILGGLEFYFSSELYMQKFKKLVVNFMNEETTIRYNVNINLDLFFAISLYKRIEKRGFRIYDRNIEKEIKSDVLFINKIIKE